MPALGHILKRLSKLKNLKIRRPINIILSRNVVRRIFKTPKLRERVGWDVPYVANFFFLIFQTKVKVRSNYVSIVLETRMEVGKMAVIKVKNSSFQVCSLRALGGSTMYCARS